MSEPDWRQFEIDDLLDPPAVKQEKLEGFMRAFIGWREEERNVSRKKSAKKKGARR